MGLLPADKNRDKNTTPPKGKYDNYSLGAIGHNTVFGSGVLFPSDTGLGATVFGSRVGAPPATFKDYNANQTIYHFTQLPAAQLAAIQDQLYRAGLYPASFYPIPGHLQQADIDAFKKFVKGVAASGKNIASELALAAQFGDAIGIRAPTEKRLREQQPPLTVTLDNPEDIKAVVKGVTEKLYSGKLSPEQEDLFVMLVQNAQADFQRAQYSQQYNTVDYSRDPNSESNYYGPGGTLVAPPSGAGLAKQAEEFVRNANPQQVFTSTLGRNLAQLLPGLARPGAGLL